MIVPRGTYEVTMKSNVTIYLPDDVLERCRAAATEDGRSLSNYLSGLLERAHPPTTATRQLHIEDAIARSVKRGPSKTSKHK